MSMMGNLVSLPVARLETLLEDPSGVIPFLDEEERGADVRHIDLDKAWHALDFLLNGGADTVEGPLAVAVLGGQEIGEDIGYGPACWISAEQVAAVDAALARIPVSELRARFDGAAMDAAEIYPNIWEEEGEEGLDYILEYHADLVAFYREAAASGHAVLRFIN
ncbi:YfbM family protein [Stenotrophomonas sp. PS02289]|uniref:YfbM family protein n=1 Tax=Stenotrophomonas sp. PS02289 TaxID=2991422 RepID=UPI00249CD8C7|nr:YfbM family protein [Stenotrophomonas sp. PS02289]